MDSRREWEDRTRLDLNPADDPVPVAQQPVVAQPVIAHQPVVAQTPVVEEEVVDSRVRRARVVRNVNTVITMICGLFAVVLALHIVLTLFDANPRNGFAGFINGWSSAVSLGLRNLFTPDSAKLRVFFNDGMAAIGWLVMGAVITYAIRQFALPGPRTTVQYQRRIVN
jgi:hypothetical protein